MRGSGVARLEMISNTRPSTGCVRRDAGNEISNFSGDLACAIAQHTSSIIQRIRQVYTSLSVSNYDHLWLVSRTAILALLTLPLPAATHDIRRFGAKGDGATKDTAAIQAAIEAASKEGGGTVEIPAGRYLSGTIHLRSNITLHLANGAVLLGSPDNGDYTPYEPLDFKSPDDNETTYFRYSLITGEQIHHVAITGEGIIDGNRSRRGGPKGIALKLSEHIAIRGVTVQNTPNYAISFLGCDYVVVDGVTILNSYADGIDPDSSRYVRISNCFVDAWDDAICPKASYALGKRRATEHVTVTNCVLRTSCNHFKLGTESEGGFKDIAVTNCTMLRRAAGRRPISGIALESVDGAEIDRVVISNITMHEPRAAIFLRLGNRGRAMTPPVPGALRNVSIQNVVATAVEMASSITGLRGAPVRRVSLDNINITMDGTAGAGRGLDVPEVPEKYPEATMFGELPAHGLYARHVEELILRNLQIATPKDARPALVLDDVRDLEINTLKASGEPVVWLNDVEKYTIIPPLAPRLVRVK
jgi:polygalacturonase